MKKFEKYFAKESWNLPEQYIYYWKNEKTKFPLQNDNTCCIPGKSHTSTQSRIFPRVAGQKNEQREVRTWLFWYIVRIIRFTQLHRALYQICDHFSKPKSKTKQVYPHHHTLVLSITSVAAVDRKQEFRYPFSSGRTRCWEEARSSVRHLIVLMARQRCRPAKRGKF